MDWSTVTWVALSLLGPPIVWALLVVAFPKLVGDVLLRTVEYRQNRRLEEMKAELAAKNASELQRFKADAEAAYATLRSSVEFVSSSQSELQARRIASSERLWDALLAVDHEFGDLVFFEMILTREEIAEGFRSGNGGAMFRYAEKYRDRNATTAMWERTGAMALDKERLFVNDRLWLLFFVQRALFGRFAVLYDFSFKERRYRDWRSDTAFESLCKHVIPDELIASAKRQPLAGFKSLIAYVEVQFLQEAAGVMSGLRYLKDTLPDVQSMVIVEKEKIAADMYKSDG